MSPGGAVAVAWLVYGYTGAGGCAMAGDGGHSEAGMVRWPLSVALALASI